MLFATPLETARIGGLDSNSFIELQNMALEEAVYLCAYSFCYIHRLKKDLFPKRRRHSLDADKLQHRNRQN